MKLSLIETKPEVTGVVSFIFKPEEALSWKPGQYMHVMLPHENADDRGTERWFTISAAPFEINPSITTRIAADKGSSFKHALTALKAGDSVEVDYVDGDFTVDDAEKEYVFIAGGIGITPFHSILKEADHAGVKFNVTLIYANRDENVPFKMEIDSFASRNPNLHVHYLTSPQQIDEASIKEIVSDLMKPIFYLSGPEPMVKSLADVLKNMSIPAEHVKLDDFPGYEQY